MAQNTQYSKIGKTYSVISDITVAPIRMATQDIGTWKDATNAARDIHFPRRRQLYELYDNLAADGKVITVKNKRKAAIGNKNFVFYKKGKKGDPVERIQNEIIDTIWFDEMLELLEVEEEFHGHVCIELVPGTKAPIESILHIPKANVVPETGLILPNYMDTLNGYLFRGEKADPKCKKFILEFGKQKNLGLMWNIAQYVIYKRGGFGDWGQFAELFGMPFRVGKYNPHDPTTRRLLNDALKEMGGAGYGVIPEGTALEFIQSNYGSGQSGIFKDLIQACNDEISQIALGGTMTTEDGASKAQGEVHKEGEHEISTARLKKILKFLNGPFRQRLVDHFGYPEAAEGSFKVESSDLLSLKDRIEIDERLNKIVEIDPVYFYDTYGVPPGKNGAKALQAAKQNEPAANNEPEKKKKLSLQLNAIYNHSCPRCSPLINNRGLNLAASPTSEIERLAKLLHRGVLKKGMVDKKILKQNAAKLWQAVISGYLTKPSDFTQADKDLIELMQNNVYLFSGFKTEKMLRQASEALIENGQIVPFDEFKEKFKIIDHTYNVNYLQAEYNLAVASGQMASKWVRFKELAPEFQNWVYTTAGDDRVRPLHAELNGKVFKIGNPSTDILFPPNGFNCRCDGDATDQNTNSDGLQVDTKQLGMFAHNVGQSGAVFPPSHPYFEASKKTTEYVTKIANSVKNGS